MGCASDYSQKFTHVNSLINIIKMQKNICFIDNSKKIKQLEKFETFMKNGAHDTRPITFVRVRGRTLNL